MKSNLPNLSRNADAHVVVGVRLRAVLLEVRAGRFLAPAPFNGLVIACPADMITSISTPFSGILSPGFRIFRLPGQFDVRLVRRSHVGPGNFDRVAVIHVHLDRDQLRERGHGADVVAVEVRGQQVVDLLEAGLLGGGEDALGVAIVGGAVGGVHQQGLAARRDDQRGGAAFGVDPVDFEVLGGAQGQAGAEQGNKDGFFDSMSST